MARLPLQLMIRELGRSGSCFILGAGASAPSAPLTSELPGIVRAYAKSVGSYPVHIPDSPLRRLLKNLGLGVEDSFLEWKASSLSDGAIGLLLEHRSYPRPAPCPPNYRVFKLLPLDASVISFNWDGLAQDYCPQRRVIHPHGRFWPVKRKAQDFGELLELLQELEHLTIQEALDAPIVLPGQEALPSMYPMHEEVFGVWRTCRSVFVIGFALGFTGMYDDVWRDAFVEAFKVNRVPVNIVGLNGETIAGELSELLKRRLDVCGWNYSWAILAELILRLGSLPRVLATSEAELQHMYDARADANGRTRWPQPAAGLHAGVELVQIKVGACADCL